MVMEKRTMYEMCVGLAGAVGRTAPVILTVLLLAGCSKAPAQNQNPLGYATQTTVIDADGWKTTKGGVNIVSGEYDLGAGPYVASKERPIVKFHYKGGAWCKVWADAEGIHWEACK